MNAHQNINADLSHSIPVSQIANGAVSFSNQNGYNQGGYNAVKGGPLSIQQILEVVRKWWWLIGMVTVLITALAAMILFRLTPVYQASSILQVKQQDRQIFDGASVENIVNDKEFFVTQIELLKSERLAESVIDAEKLLSDSFFFDPTSETWPTLSRSERVGVLVDGFKSRMDVTPVGRSRLVKVSFEHSNSKKAASIANRIVETYIQDYQSDDLRENAFKRKFLEESLAEVKLSLEKAERDLVRYASQNSIINVVANGDSKEVTGSLNNASLVALDSELTAAQTVRIQAEAKLEQFEASEFLDNLAPSETQNKLQETLRNLELEYVEKSAIFKSGFPEMEELQSRIDIVRASVLREREALIGIERAALKAELNLAKSLESNLASRVARLKGSVIDVREKSIQYNILKREVDSERAQYEGILLSLKNANISGDVGTNLVQIVDTAKPPRKASKPKIPQSLAIIFLLSLAAGFGLAYLIEIIDDKIKTPEDVKQKLNQVIMGVIPFTKSQDDLEKVLSESQSGITEAYASLRTNLQLSGANGGPKVIQLTSTRSGEGKSVSSMGLAMRFAGVDERVLLIDGDMRLPTFLRGTGDSLGLSGVLTQDVRFEDNIQTTRFPNLLLLPSGVPVPNPSELLSSARFDALLEYGKDNFDRIIIDSPPVLGLADALILGAKVDATLLIVQSKTLRANAVKSTIERLAVSGRNVLGVVMTKYQAKTSGYSNYYQYSYGGKQKSSMSNTIVKPKLKRQFDLSVKVDER